MTPIADAGWRSAVTPAPQCSPLASERWRHLGKPGCYGPPPGGLGACECRPGTLC
jgi:hypothetical protein